PRLVDGVLVGQEADVPVPQAVFAELQGAFQAQGHAEGVQLALGGARHLPEAAQPKGITGARVGVEVAVGGDQAVVVLARVAGDLLVGGAAVVADVAGEADAVGDVVVAADEQRLTLDARLHHHLLVGVGQFRFGDVVVVAGVARVGALVQRAQAAGAGRIREVAGTVDVAQPQAVLADHAPAVVRDVGAVAVPGELAVLAVDRIVLGVLGADRDAAAVVAGAQGDAVVLLGLAFVERTDVAIEFGAFEVAAGDDVDHAGDGVGAVDGGRAVLQDFDALDGGHRHLA